MIFRTFLLSVLVLFFGATPSFAEVEWSTSTMTEPTAGHTASLSVRPGKEYFFFVKNGVDTYSGWIFLPASVNVDICYDNDTSEEDPSAATASGVISVLHVPHSNLNVSPSGEDDGRSQALLGISLDGVASTSGTTNDCIYDVKGPIWIAIRIDTSDSDDDGLVSMAPRQF